LKNHVTINHKIYQLKEFIMKKIIIVFTLILAIVSVNAQNSTKEYENSVFRLDTEKKLKISFNEQWLDLSEAGELQGDYDRFTVYRSFNNPMLGATGNSKPYILKFATAKDLYLYIDIARYKSSEDIKEPFSGMLIYDEKDKSLKFFANNIWTRVIN